MDVGNPPSFLKGRGAPIAAFGVALGLCAAASAQTTFDVAPERTAVVPTMPTPPSPPSHTGAGHAPPAEAAAADALRRAALTLDTRPTLPASTQAIQIDAPQAGPTPPAASTAFSTPLEGLMTVSRLTRDKQYQAAVPLSKKVLTLTERDFGKTSLATANAYILLGKVQNKAGEHDAAEKSYLQGIGMISNADGQFSQRMIDPLVGLGDNYQAAGRYLDAVSAYGQARGITRRVYGLLSPDQVPILDRISDAFIKLDKYDDANARQREILRLSERKHPVGSPPYLDGIYAYAQWLGSTGRYVSEREQYQHALGIIRDQHGRGSTLLIKPLRMEGNSYRVQGFPERTGYTALQSALDIANQASPPDPATRARLLTDIGDWQVAFGDSAADTAPYEKAWQVLGTAGGAAGLRLRQEWFSTLHNILRVPVSRARLSDDFDALPGHVTVQFDVDNQGHPRNLQVTESDPPGLKDQDVMTALRGWRYRPVVENGKPVTKGPVALRFNFRYEPKADNKKND